MPYRPRSEFIQRCFEKAGNSESGKGACRFLFDEWDTLNPHGLQNVVIPIKAIQVSYVLNENPQNPRIRELSEKRLREALERQGLFVPTKILNLEELGLSDLLERSGSNLPLGITRGNVKLPIGKVSGAVFSCASCHAGRVYDSQGLPTNQAWLGIPNSSYNVEGLIDEMYQALNRVVDQWPRFIKLYPQVHGVRPLSGDMLGLRLSHSQLKSKMTSLRETIGRFRPYASGAPGLTNGIAAIEYNLGLFERPTEYRPDDNALVGAPVLYQREFRAGLLTDGFYGIDPPAQRTEITAELLSDPAVRESRIAKVAKIASIFTIGTVGTEPSRADRIHAEVTQAIRLTTALKPPRFPGKIEFDRAEAGRSIYDQSCAKCHGTYEGPLTDLRLTRFPNQRVSLDRIGTDPLRVERITERDVEFLRSLRIGRGIEVARREGYVAPMLNGIWATAPYLHNGSVPTLWHLMHPESRPQIFKHGGHALDFDRMGISYPEGYMPVSTPVDYDTRRVGQSNRGHEKPFSNLNENEKTALLEFLKTL